MPNGPPSWTPAEVAIAELHLDPDNPRLRQPWNGEDEIGLYAHIEAAYDPIAVARSVAEYGYFASEPMIVMERETGGYTVLEGNRRLVALKGLSDPEIRSTLKDPEWNELSGSVHVPSKIPVVVVRSWEEAAPIIGYRHISGIQQWDPYAKARYIARLVDDNNYDFSQAAQVVGEEPSEVRSAYRNFHILDQARVEFGLDTSAVQRGFGVFTRAMTSSGIREHIGAPQPRSVRRGEPPLDKSKSKELGEIIDWIYGSDNSEPVIEDSRELDNLGRAITTAEGLSTMREVRNLQRAVEASRGRKQRLIGKLNTARNAIRAAGEDLPRFATDPEVIESLREVEISLHQLFEDNGIPD